MSNWSFLVTRLSQESELSISRTPEQRLLAAITVRAFWDLVSQCKTVKREAYHWITSRRQGEFTFAWCMYQLNLTYIVPSAAILAKELLESDIAAERLLKYHEDRRHVSSTYERKEKKESKRKTKRL